MKKSLLFLILIFGVSASFAQGSCNTALDVLVNTTTSAPAYTNETGTAPTALCGMTGGVGSKGKWYKYTALTSSTIIISTYLPQNNNQDTRVIVYSGNCLSLTCVTANDDYNGTNSSYITFPATMGSTYIIAFDNRYDSNAFDFTLMEGPPPAADRLTFTSQVVSGITGGYNNCIVDMNGDYKDDIVSSISTTQLAITYQQTGGTFTTSTYTVPNTSVLPSWSITAGDYDNNGFNDLIFGSGSGVVFLKANSTGTAFTNATPPPEP